MSRTGDLFGLELDDGRRRRVPVTRAPTGMPSEERAYEARLRLYFGADQVPARGFSLYAHRSPGARRARRALDAATAQRAADRSGAESAEIGMAVREAAAWLLASLEEAEAVHFTRADELSRE